MLPGQITGKDVMSFRAWLLMSLLLGQEGCLLHREEPHRQAPGLGKRQKGQARMWARAYFVVFAGRNRQDGGSRLRLASLSSNSQQVRLARVRELCPLVRPLGHG